MLRAHSVLSHSSLCRLAHVLPALASDVALFLYLSSSLCSPSLSPSLHVPSQGPLGFTDEKHGRRSVSVESFCFLYGRIEIPLITLIFAPIISSISVLLSSAFPSTVTPSLAWTFKLSDSSEGWEENMADLLSSDNSSCTIFHLCASFHFRRPHAFLHGAQNFPSASGRLKLLSGKEPAQTAQWGDLIRKEILKTLPWNATRTFQL